MTHRNVTEHGYVTCTCGRLIADCGCRGLYLIQRVVRGGCADCQTAPAEVVLETAVNAARRAAGSVTWEGGP
jgi:hypothetical protein